MSERRPTHPGTLPQSFSVATIPIVRVKLRASLDDDEELTHIYNWLDRWKRKISVCKRSGGVWDERFEVVAPSDAIRELNTNLIQARTEEC